MYRRSHVFNTPATRLQILNIAIWLSGYYHGKRGDTTLETQALIANAKKVRDYCFRNPQTLVMNAVEKVLGGERR